MDALALPLGLIGMFAGPVAISFATYRLMMRAIRRLEAALERSEPREPGPAITTITFRGASLTVGAGNRFDRAA